MAEGFEPYHVPQQSRRDKLRVLAQTHDPTCIEPGAPPPPPHHHHHHHHLHGLLPLYDPTSLISSSDLLTCTNPVVKEEGHGQGQVNLMMGFVNGGGVVNNNNASSNSTSSSSSTFHRNPYLDPQPSFPINPASSIHDINGGNFFLYPQHNLHNLRDFEHHQAVGYGGAHHDHNNQVVVFKPEPLSLSLSSQSTHHQQQLPLELNLQRYGSSLYNSGVSVASASNDVINGPTTSSGPLGPFTGYASILKGSRFLKPAQQLLEEFCDVGTSREIYTAKAMVATDSSFMDPPIESLNAMDNDPVSETRGKKSRLISMLDEVYRRYKQYYQQMQTVVTSFEYVAGLGNAAPYANLAIKAMTRHFKCLKNAITDQLQFRNRDETNLSHGKDETSMLRNTSRVPYSQRSIHNAEFVDHQPVWRPQRGLPERAVTVLRAWLFEHFLHPYPTDTDKLTLAKQTGLSRSQVSNWFINARVRLWKPMVEEIHMLETRQAQKASQRVDRNSDRSSDQDLLPSTENSLASDQNASTSTHRTQDTVPKHTRNELPNHITMGSTEQLNLSYNNLPSHMHVGHHVGMSMAGGGSSGVSLTLGLHQNNGTIGLSEPYPINAAQRFGLGLEGSGEGYGMSGFDAQNRHFGRDVIGGQLLHDFVG